MSEPFYNELFIQRNWLPAAVHQFINLIWKLAESVGLEPTPYCFKGSGAALHHDSINWCWHGHRTRKIYVCSTTHNFCQHKWYTQRGSNPHRPLGHRLRVCYSATRVLDALKMVVEKNFEILALPLSRGCSASELLDVKSGVFTYIYRLNTELAELSEHTISEIGALGRIWTCVGNLYPAA